MKVLQRARAFALAATATINCGVEATKGSGSNVKIDPFAPPFMQHRRQNVNNDRRQENLVRKLLTGARRLEDGGGGNGYAIQDVSGYSVSFGKCMRVKISNNNDDDDQEGNQYFYNGKYHSQTQGYASFFLCQSGCDEDSCDYSREYVVDLETYLEANVEYVQTYCNACQNYCRRRDLAGDERNLEDGDAAYADCSSCKDQCYPLLNEAAGNADEVNYIECQEAYEDGDGLQVYSAPACSSDGAIQIGLFYDDECTVKKSAEYSDMGFNYNTFRTVENMCLSCANDDDAYNMCADLYQDGLHCSGGKNVNYNAEADEDVPVCKAYANSAIVHTYNQRKKKNPLKGIVIAVVVIASLAAFGSYTYFVRHRKNQKAPLAEQGNDVTGEPAPIGTQEGRMA